jgi:hypothetical protein
MQARFLAFAIATSIVCLPTSAYAETLDNAAVVRLVSVGLSDDVIISKIKASANTFDVSTDALIGLKSSGVSGAVIAAMIDASAGAAVTANAAASADSPDPKVPHPSGVYLLASWLAAPKMLPIDATTSNQTKTGNFLGYAFSGGIASISFKAVIPGENARITSDVSKPKFYFYFDQANRSLSSGGSSPFFGSGSVTSPAEFSLVRFSVKSGRREAKVGKFNIAGAKAGVMDKDRIPFSYEGVSTGVFEVTPDKELETGEYGFIYSASTGGGIGMAGMGAMSNRIFDFSIKAATKQNP